MATIHRRISVTLTPELEREIDRLKMTKEFCRKPVSDVIRYLLDKATNNSQRPTKTA